MLTQREVQEVHLHTPIGVVALDAQGIIVFSNPRFGQFVSGDAHLGKPASLFLEKAVEADKGAHLLAEEAVLDKEYCLNSSKESKTVLINSNRITDESGTLQYLFIRDITRLKKKERLFTYLNSAVEVLGSARDTHTSLAHISEIIVPKFANWFSIDLLKDNAIEELVLAHEDPEMIIWARKYREAYPTDMTDDTGLPGVLKTGKSSHIPVVTEEMILAGTPNPEQLLLIQKMHLRSVLIVPIIFKSLVKGAITFVSSAEDNYYDEYDLEFAESFASHIGIALENARLNEAAAAELLRRQEVESQLRITQVKLKSALSSGLVGTWISDLESDTIYMDENLSRMYGVPFSATGSKQDIINPSIHPDDLHLLQPQNRMILMDGRFYEAEFRVLREGETRWFFARGSLDISDSKQLYGGVVIDITQRKEAELALVENEERFRFLANAIPHKLWTSNPDGSVNYYNQGWYDYTGIHDFEGLKSGIWDMIHPDERKRAEIEWPKAIRLGENHSVEHRLKRFDGEYRWHLSRFSAHRNEKGEIILWVGTSTDIDEQKKLEQQKDEFLSIASHELKTPLTSIKAFNQIIARVAADDVKLSQFIEKSAQHIFRLERLITDLLDVTKINAGKLSYNFEEFPFQELLVHTKDNFQYNTTHQIIIENSVDAHIYGDRFRLEQVLDNLLANAIKYSPEADRVLINSKIEDDHLIISVRDFGIGIEAEKIDKLFERYYRVDNSAIRFEGLGLGLYISNEILKRHQGSICINSKVGQGSTFFLKLPILAAPDQTTSPSP